MGIFKSLSGVVTVELTSGNVAQSLAHITAAGIHLFRVEVRDELTARFRVSRSDYARVRKTAARKGDSLRIVSRGGLYWNLKMLIRRPILVAGLLMILFMSLILTGRILFIRVEGNSRIPSNLILEAAADNGVCFGAAGREVRSEKVKNALLEAIPELQWAGVNTRGCVAIISVRERTSGEDVPEETGISSIAAERDGIILSYTVCKGTGACVPGQAVKAGEILISGYTDCGLCISATRAEGEIEALTNRTLTVKTPGICEFQLSEGKTKSNYSLIIGKKHVFFKKDSGIYDASCVKMYSKYVLTLPGGFQLPVALVKETVQYRNTAPGEISNEATASLLKAFAQQYLHSQMRGGRIIRGAQSMDDTPKLRCLSSVYICREFIGIRVQEQIGVIP